MLPRINVTPKLSAIAVVVFLFLVVSVVSVSGALDRASEEGRSEQPVTTVEEVQVQEPAAAIEEKQPQEPEATEEPAAPQEPEVPVVEESQEPPPQEPVVAAEEGQPEKVKVVVAEPQQQEEKPEATAEEAPPEEPETATDDVRDREQRRSDALEALAELRAKESAAFQAYNNALHEQEDPGEIEARRERFENVEAEKDAYIDSLSEETREQIETEQQKEIEQAQAAAPEVREKYAVEDTPEPAPEPRTDLQNQQVIEEEPVNAAEMQYQEEAVAPIQEEEVAPAEENEPPSEAAEAVVAEAAAFIGTPAVEEGVMPEEEAAANQDQGSTGAAGTQYEDQGASPNQQQREPARDRNSGGSTPSSPSGNRVVAEAANYYGTPYELGGPAQCVPYEAMDCSCLTMTVYAEFGIYMPDDPHAQMGYGTPVSGEPRAGDLVFWSEDGSGVATHVGIATGNGTTIHASAYAGYVLETAIEYIPGYMGARRLL